MLCEWTSLRFYNTLKLVIHFHIISYGQYSIFHRNQFLFWKLCNYLYPICFFLALILRCTAGLSGCWCCWCCFVAVVFGCCSFILINHIKNPFLRMLCVYYISLAAIVPSMRWRPSSAHIYFRYHPNPINIAKCNHKSKILLESNLKSWNVREISRCNIIKNLDRSCIFRILFSYTFRWWRTVL